jgi:FkbM family methyltransferase
MDKRMRKMVIDDDERRLREMGVEPRGHWMYDIYRQSARAGEFDLLPRFVPPGKAAVDVGANAGMYTVKLAAMCRRVLAIEPLGDYAWLGDELPPNCRFAAFAAGAEAGRAELNVPAPDGNRMGGLASLLDLEPWGYTECETEAVQVRTLDNLADEYLADENVGFVKIDVEGAELEVLRGATALLERDRPNLQVELWKDHVPGAVQFIGGLGYRGLFTFDGLLNDIGRFDPAVHCAEENNWTPETADSFRPELYVNNFFFLPAE